VASLATESHFSSSYPIVLFLPILMSYYNKRFQLIELDESRRNALSQMGRNKEKIKNTFDHKAKERDFAKGDLVLLWDNTVKILCNCKEYSYPLLWIKIKYIYY
jgi:hypothetical protein